MIDNLQYNSTSLMESPFDQKLHLVWTYPFGIRIQ